MPSFHLPPSSAYLVALSGGADSRLLLELTIRALLERGAQDGRKDLGLQLTAAHLHHGIRGEEADRDESFCRRLCEDAGIPLVVEHADIPALAAASGESIETAARRARYDFFRRVMTEKRIPTLLTAHHADDNLETLLDRLLRGSGTRGMGGIPPTRPMGQTPNGTPLTVVRPLLEWTRQDVQATCKILGLTYVTDSTNNDIEYTRNRLRHTVIPALEALAGRGIPQKAAIRLARTAREDEDYLVGIAEEQVIHCLTPDGGLPADVLQRQHPAIAKRMMTCLYIRATAGTHPEDGCGSLSSTHLDALCGLVQNARPESTVSLPGGMEARIRNGQLYIRSREMSPAPTFPTPLPMGCTRFGDDVTILLETSPVLLPPREGDTVWASAIFPPDIPLPLVARKREAGDTILSHGMHKKLKKMLCDKEIPLHLRDVLPLLCLPDGSPLWYPAVVFRDGYPPPLEGSCLRITVFLKRK